MLLMNLQAQPVFLLGAAQTVRQRRRPRPKYSAGSPLRAARLPVQRLGWCVEGSLANGNEEQVGPGTHTGNVAHNSGNARDPCQSLLHGLMAGLQLWIHGEPFVCWVAPPPRSIVPQCALRAA